MKKLIVLYFIVLTGLYADNISKAEEYKQIANSNYSNDFDSSLNYINKSIKLNPKDIRSFSVRAVIYSYWGMKLSNNTYLSQAWSDYTTCINAVNNNEFEFSKIEIFANIYMLRGSLSILAKNYNQGLYDYTKACQLNQDNCQTLESVKKLVSQLYKEQ